jgi:hypothetical protein
MNTICIFDVATTKQVDEIRLYQDGPYVIQGVQGFYCQSRDSIWIYKQWERELLLVNHEGIILKKANIFSHVSPTATPRLPSSPFPMTDLPIKRAGKYLIFQGMDRRDRDNTHLPHTVTALYNPATDETVFANSYPEIYGKEDEIVERWGAFSYRTIPYDLDENGNMVLSFQADDNVVVYNIEKDETESYFAGYSAETDIKPLPMGYSRTDELRHYLANYTYPGIYYDKYRHLFYRLVTLPNKDYDWNNKESLIKKLAIIILNDKFEKVGEYVPSEKTNILINCFVSPEGFHVNVVSDDDDYLKFFTFKPVKK